MPDEASGDRPRGAGPPRQSRRALGRYGEELAEAFLRRQGFRILARNVHVRYAEIDLIALDRRVLCFVEVRLRSGDRFGRAEESVGRRKARRIVAAAREVLATRRLPRYDSIRFDVIAVDASVAPPTINLLRAAFEA